MFEGNSIVPVTQSPQRAKAEPMFKPETSQEVPIREMTRWEIDAAKRKEPPKPQEVVTDDVAERYKLYTADKGSTRSYFSDFKQKTEVMRSTDDRISTKYEDRKTISAVMDLAKSKGWGIVDLRGSEEFKREGWVQAQLRDIKTTGYQPKNTDLQELARLKAERAPAAAPQQQSAPSAQTAGGTAKASAAAPKQPAAAASQTVLITKAAQTNGTKTNGNQWKGMVQNGKAQKDEEIRIDPMAAAMAASSSTQRKGMTQ